MLYDLMGSFNNDNKSNGKLQSIRILGKLCIFQLSDLSMTCIKPASHLIPSTEVLSGFVL